MTHESIYWSEVKNSTATGKSGAIKKRIGKNVYQVLAGDKMFKKHATPVKKNNSNAIIIESSHLDYNMVKWVSYSVGK